MFASMRASRTHPNAREPVRHPLLARTRLRVGEAIPYPRRQLPPERERAKAPCWLPTAFSLELFSLWFPAPPIHLRTGRVGRQTAPAFRTERPRYRHSSRCPAGPGRPMVSLEQTMSLLQLMAALGLRLVLFLPFDEPL